MNLLQNIVTKQMRKMFSGLEGSQMAINPEVTVNETEHHGI